MVMPVRWFPIQTRPVEGATAVMSSELTEPYAASPGGGSDGSSVLLLLSALHRLADLDPEFSFSVSRERLRYLVTMETLGRCWRQMRLTTQHGR